MEHEGDDNTNHNWDTWSDLQKASEGTEKWEIGGPAETIQTIVLQRSVRILRRVLKT